MRVVRRALSCEKEQFVDFKVNVELKDLAPLIVSC